MVKLDQLNRKLKSWSEELLRPPVSTESKTHVTYMCVHFTVRLNNYFKSKPSLNIYT